LEGIGHGLIKVQSRNFSGVIEETQEKSPSVIVGVTVAVTSSVTVISLLFAFILMSCATVVAKAMLVLFYLMFCCLLVGLVALDLAVWFTLSVRITGPCGM
jgi:hypothetical protein